MLARTAIVIAAVGALLSRAPAAQVVINNLVMGPGDTLYALRDGTLMDGGSLHLGYFPAGVDFTDLGTIPQLLAQLSSFTTVRSAVPGGFNDVLGSALPGYAVRDVLPSIGLIDHESPLLGRTLYQIVTDAPDLQAVTGQSQFALLAMATLRPDIPWEQTYTSNPADLVPIIGTLGTFHGDAGAGEGVYLTLKMDVVPEASVGWMMALGGAVVFRRRR